MERIEPPNSHFLSAATGWLELGNWKEAQKELDQIDPGLLAHPEVLLVQYGIQVAAGNWQAAADTAECSLRLAPSDPQHWIAWAFATRRSPEAGIPAAKNILLRARELFPREPIICYNLACYECQSNRLTEAKSWLREACKIGSQKTIKKMAMEDPDLAALRPELDRL